jgi:hypothetical protein
MRDKCCSNESKNLSLFTGGLRNDDSIYEPLIFNSANNVQQVRDIFCSSTLHRLQS